MKNKFTLLIALLLIAFAGSAQPNTYERAQSYYQSYHADLFRFVEQQKKQFDVTIPIEERIPVAPTERSLADVNWGVQWHKVLANLEKLKAAAKRPVKVYVFDTGAGYSNTNLNAAWDKQRSRDYVPDGTNIDIQSHSTHVSGIIAADDPNIGICAGLVQKGLLTIAPQEVLNDDGSGDFVTNIDPAIAAANKDARELIKQGYFVEYNFSLGGSGTVPAATDKLLKEAQEIGVLVLCAAGNTYSEGVGAPGNSKYVYAIAALQQDVSGVSRAPYSTYGKEVFGAAAGSAIYSTTPNNTRKSYSGTSMATPQFAALCAWIGSVYPDLNAAQVAALAIKTMQDIAPDGRDIYTGYGSPMANLFLDQTPVDTIPDPTPPIKVQSRTITIPVQGAVKILWSANDNVFQYAEIGGLLIEYTTTETAADAYKRINDLVKNFFTNRGLVVPANQKSVDWAGKWSVYFLELLSKQDGLQIKVKEAWVASSGDNKDLNQYDKSFPAQVRGADYAASLVKSKRADKAIAHIKKNNGGVYTFKMKN